MIQIKQQPESELDSPVRAVADFLLLAVCLIFLFRLFVAEPFEVPTSSMEPTLLGRHQTACCPHCGFGISIPFPRPSNAGNQTLCQNCQESISIPTNEPIGGDRVVVAKTNAAALKRFDVVVFKSPEEASVPYVKRLIGLPGETIRIRAGEIEVQRECDSSFQICRKPPNLVLAMAQPIYDDRFRNTAKTAHWKSNEPEGWRYVNRGYEACGDQAVSLEYQFRITDVPMVEPIDASNLLPASAVNVFPAKFSNEVDDLLLDVSIIPSAGCRDVSLTLQSRRGPATLRWNPDQQKVAILQTGKELWRGELARPAKEAKLRFANVDRSLILWNEDELLASVPYDANANHQAAIDRSLSPVSICVTGKGSRVTDLVLRRDIYYRRSSRAIDALSEPAHAPVDPLISGGESDPSSAESTEWRLGPKEYFVLGDNSADSNDSRHWRQGPALPERLVLGRVVWNLGSGDLHHFGLMEPR